MRRAHAARDGCAGRHGEGEHLRAGDRVGIDGGGAAGAGCARAVGQAAAGAVVLGCAAIFLLDFLLTTTLARWLT
ncbi:hypothetical protein ACN28E_39640 [Archangium lansingense]|uniref:hypothetical protein n=1 Tax=Archangium lansingense TaxID=2995310 RepID=UPI003B7822E1